MTERKKKSTLEKSFQPEDEKEKENNERKK